jgi:hypothetical protein
VPGFVWLNFALVALDGQESAVYQFLREYPNAYGVGLHAGAAMAFSPDGAMEVWGNQKITISLGKSLSSR